MNDNVIVLIDVCNKLTVSFYFLSLCSWYSCVQVRDVKLISGNLGQRQYMWCARHKSHRWNWNDRLLWRIWRQAVLPKHWHISFTLHSFLSQKIVIVCQTAQCDVPEMFTFLLLINLKTTRLPGEVRWLQSSPRQLTSFPSSTLH